MPGFFDNDTPLFPAVTFVVKVEMPITLRDKDWSARAEEIQTTIRDTVFEVFDNIGQSDERWSVGGDVIS